ncbi:MAG: beta-lactamase family protein [Gemmatimonadota bacterium]|nr:MAG: beta-lactamase family protein [Gemmatimonadota bacterium]
MHRVLLLALTLVAFPAQTAHAQAQENYSDDPTMPGGHLGERLRSLLSTLNSPTPEAVERFMAEECTEGFRNFASLETHIATFGFLHRYTGGADFHSIRTYTPERERETVVIVKDRNYGAWRAFRLFIDERETYLLAGLLLDRYPGTPTDVELPTLGEAEVIDETRRIVDRICANDAFSGTVLLARGAEVLYSHACGEASKRFGVPIDLDTRFNLSSVTKSFTGTAIVQLAEAGVLSYDDPLSDHVDESWLPRDISSRIRLHHLLTHTSGLGDYYTDEYGDASRELFRRLEDFKPHVVQDTLAFEPGSSFRYSNTGIFLLGVVIQNVSGVSYFDYVRNNIFGPAGMDDTGYFDRDEPVRNVAIGYYRDASSASGWREDTFKLPVGATPATQSYSTVGDLHRYALALLDGKLVSGSSLEVMWRRYGEGDGYGFQVHQRPIGLAVGHTGGSWGASSHLTIYPEAGYIVVALSNYRTGASPLVERIEQLIERTR